jgi:hypothetical protein
LKEKINSMVSDCHQLGSFAFIFQTKISSLWLLQVISKNVCKFFFNNHLSLLEVSINDKFLCMITISQITYFSTFDIFQSWFWNGNRKMANLDLANKGTIWGKQQYYLGYFRLLLLVVYLML